MAEEDKKPEAEEPAEGAAPVEGAAAAETPADGAAPAEGEGEEGKEELAPIIVKKIIDEGHGGAHGGAWKIALADMMTAMMAFFLLMWLLGATNTSQRKSIADYFKPTALTKSAITVNNTSGSIGVMGGQSIIDETSLPNSSAQTGLMQVITPRDDTGSKDSEKSKDKSQEELDEEAKKKVAKELDQENFEKLVKELNEKLSQDKDMAKLKEQVNFVREKEGLRIEVIDKADFSMFSLGTNQMSPKAQALIAEIAKSVAAMPNPVKVRGHTDALPFNKDGRNNWSLSAERAEITRQMMVAKGVPESRFSRIEGVADKEPFNATDPKDPRNRRISITLQYRD